ncbi:hypothetical protein Zm00014a_026360 [Zea mays]|uniref:Uncharacterized protein n=1 Tax=Zea mays TaxID=4577 RepID=A0A3L6DCD8_MAIZE|nr:hypothetical protein Zm00014a_026360 [Zea mays]
MPVSTIQPPLCLSGLGDTATANTPTGAQGCPSPGAGAAALHHDLASAAPVIDLPPSHQQLALASSCVCCSDWPPWRKEA